MRPARGARSRSRCATSAYGADDYASSERARVRASFTRDDDADDDRLRRGALLDFEAHALARSRSTLVVGGCAPALDGDAVALFARALITADALARILADDADVFVDPTRLARGRLDAADARALVARISEAFSF